MGFPKPDQAAPHYFTYINRISGDNIVELLESQLRDTTALLSGVSEERSLHRYAPEKWSIRQVLSHVNDTERVFAFRALWFGRGFSDPLPEFRSERQRYRCSGRRVFMGRSCPGVPENPTGYRRIFPQSAR